MVGRDLLALYPPRPPAPTGEPALEVTNFGAAGFAEGASFSVRPGEIVGFSGLVAADGPNCARLYSGCARHGEIG